MWLHRNTNIKYPAYNKNVERWWVEWPMWVAAGQVNSKGYQATQSVIMPDNGRNRLWNSSFVGGDVGLYAQSCDFDDYGYSYFCGSGGTIKRDIMTDTQIWATSSGSTEYIIRVNNDYVYIGTANASRKLRKLDLNGNLIWQISATPSYFSALEFDDSGNIYACGFDYIIKYDSSGVHQWSYNFSRLNGLDIKRYSDKLYVTGEYGGEFPWPTNGAIFVFDTAGTLVWNFGEELLNRGIGNYYQAIEVDANYVYVVDSSSGQGLDIYNRTTYALTFSAYTSTLLGVDRIEDLELNESGALVLSDFTGGNIYQLSSTFSYVRNWETGYTGVRGIRFKKTY